MDKIYTKIRDLRIQQGMSQEELAKKAGYSGRQAINRIELGLVDIPRSKIVSIAKALDVSPMYLISDEDTLDGTAAAKAEAIEVIAEDNPDLKEILIITADLPEERLKILKNMAKALTKDL